MTNHGGKVTCDKEDKKIFTTARRGKGREGEE
jgi:hypothetical protein